MSDGRGPVDRELVVRLGLAACKNAQALVEEANTLGDTGHHARGFALTMLATEELAKGFVCLMVRSASDDPQDWEAFWMVFGQRRHDAKIAGTLVLEHELLVMAGLPFNHMAHELSEALAGDLYEQKNRALYVDLDEEEVRTPLEIESDEEALARAATLRKAIIAWSVVIALDLETTPGMKPPSGT